MFNKGEAWILKTREVLTRNFFEKYFCNPIHLYTCKLNSWFYFHMFILTIKARYASIRRSFVFHLFLF